MCGVLLHRGGAEDAEDRVGFREDRGALAGMLARIVNLDLGCWHSAELKLRGYWCVCAVRGGGTGEGEGEGEGEGV